jgi:hypothetical protein
MLSGNARIAQHTGIFNAFALIRAGRFLFGRHGVAIKAPAPGESFLLDRERRRRDFLRPLDQSNGYANWVETDQQNNVYAFICFHCPFQPELPPRTVGRSRPFGLAKANANLPPRRFDSGRGHIS